MLTWEREAGKGASCTNNCNQWKSGGRTLKICPNLKKPYISVSLRIQGLLFAVEDEHSAYYFSMYIAYHKGNWDPYLLQCQKKLTMVMRGNEITLALQVFWITVLFQQKQRFLWLFEKTRRNVLINICFSISMLSQIHDVKK